MSEPRPASPGTNASSISVSSREARPSLGPSLAIAALKCSCAKRNRHIPGPCALRDRVGLPQPQNGRRPTERLHPDLFCPVVVSSRSVRTPARARSPKARLQHTPTAGCWSSLQGLPSEKGYSRLRRIEERREREERKTKCEWAKTWTWPKKKICCTSHGQQEILDIFADLGSRDLLAKGLGHDTKFLFRSGLLHCFAKTALRAVTVWVCSKGRDGQRDFTVNFAPLVPQRILSLVVSRLASCRRLPAKISKQHIRKKRERRRNFVVYFCGTVWQQARSRQPSCSSRVLQKRSSSCLCLQLFLFSFSSPFETSLAPPATVELDGVRSSGRRSGPLRQTSSCLNEKENQSVSNARRSRTLGGRS